MARKTRALRPDPVDAVHHPRLTEAPYSGGSCGHAVAVRAGRDRLERALDALPDRAIGRQETGRPEARVYQQPVQMLRARGRRAGRRRSRRGGRRRLLLHLRRGDPSRLRPRPGTIVAKPGDLSAGYKKIIPAPTRGRRAFQEARSSPCAPRWPSSWIRTARSGRAWWKTHESYLAHLAAEFLISCKIVGNQRTTAVDKKEDFVGASCSLRTTTILSTVLRTCEHDRRCRRRFTRSRIFEFFERFPNAQYGSGPLVHLVEQSAPAYQRADPPVERRPTPHTL